MNEPEIKLRFLAEPGEVNFGGKVHGGAVMRWIDQAGYACAVGWSGSYCVTVYVGGIRFLHPIKIGQLVEVQARLIDTGRTSMHIGIDVMACDPKGRDWQKTTHCVIVFVAVDDQGQPTPVPPWTPNTEREKASQQYARRLVELRKGIEEEMQAYGTLL